MADLDFAAQPIAYTLELNFPQMVAMSVAAAAVGGNQQPLGLRIAATLQSVRPTENRLWGELGLTMPMPTFTQASLRWTS
jgi:hypothetical protein